MTQIKQIFKIVLIGILCGFIYPQKTCGQRENNLMIVKPKSDIVSKFSRVKENLQESLYRRFQFDKEIRDELPYETWEIFETDEDKINLLNQLGAKTIVIPKHELVVDKLRITLVLMELKDGMLITIFERSMDILATENDFMNYKDWLDDQIADYSAYIDTGEPRKNFVLVKLKCKNNQHQLTNLEIEEEDVEYYSILIPTMIINYAETTKQDTIASKLRKRFKYELKDRMKPIHKNVIYGKFLFLSKDTLLVEIEGKLFSNQLQPSTPKKSVDTGSLTKATSQIAENIFNIVNENLNESND